MLIILVLTNHTAIIAIYFSIIIIVNGYPIKNFTYFNALFKLKN